MKILYNHFYAMMSRMKNIYRWGLMRNTRRENLSEHSLETAQIAHALAIINNRRLGGAADPYKAALAAVYHDSTEIITGDMPTPIKYYNSEIKSAYKQIESAAGDSLIKLIFSPDPETKRLVKAADKLSALIKCIEELKMGNREFEVAEKTIREGIKKLNCPEADIFIEEFIPSFYLSLDEQKEEQQ